MQAHPAVMLPVLGVFCLAASFTDLKAGRVPNVLSGAAAAAGLVLSGVLSGPRGLAGSLAGAVLGGSILLLPFLFRMVGGGDVKFLAAAGSITGWRLLLPSFLLGAALGAAAGLVLSAAADRSLAGVRRTLVLAHSWAWLGNMPSMEAAVERRPRADTVDAPRGGEPLRARVDAPTGPGVKIPYAVPLSAGLLVVAGARLLA